MIASQLSNRMVRIREDEFDLTRHEHTLSIPTCFRSDTPVQIRVRSLVPFCSLRRIGEGLMKCEARPVSPAYREQTH